MAQDLIPEMNHTTLSMLQIKTAATVSTMVEYLENDIKFKQADVVLLTKMYPTNLSLCTA